MEDPCVNYLLDTDSVDIALIEQRLHYLYNLDFDHSFANPWDHAMAVYLWILQQRAPAIATYCAVLALETEGTFWTRRIGYVITGKPDPYLTEFKGTRITLTEDISNEFRSLCNEAGYQDLSEFILDAVRTFGLIKKEMSGGGKLWIEASVELKEITLPGGSTRMLCK
jgi:hypothetical protein